MAELIQINVTFKKLVRDVGIKRANKMVHELHDFAIKHSHRLKTEKPIVKISNKLNEFVWAEGREHTPKLLPLLLRLDKDTVYLHLQNEMEAVKKDMEKAEKEKKKPAKEGKKTGEKEPKKTAEEKEADEVKAKKLEEKKEIEKTFDKTSMKRGTA